jgi:negative regulator of flagellin synthesis FlgM
MKIDDSPKSEKTSLPQKPDARAPDGSARRQSKTTGVDRVHLSPQAQEFQKARQALAALPDIDRDKVDEVRARLQSGRYRIDAEKIAAQMIRDRRGADD